MIMSTGGSIRRVWRDAGLILHVHVCFSGSTCWCSSHSLTILYYQDTFKAANMYVKVF